MWALAMRALRASLLAAVAAVLGCAASAPPPPGYAVRSGDAPVMARWQQFCEQATSVPQASWLASSRGADGWELVSMYNGVLCYKRPEPVRAPPFAPQSTVPQIIDPGF
jgi:hypothetical protein